MKPLQLAVTDLMLIPNQLACVNLSLSHQLPAVSGEGKIATAGKREVAHPSESYLSYCEELSRAVGGEPPASRCSCRGSGSVSVAIGG